MKLLTGALLVLADILERKEVAPGVIKDAVDNHSNAAFVTLANQIEK